MFTKPTVQTTKQSRKSMSRLLLYHDLIDGIVAAMEARDIYTLNHSARVAEITEKLCFFMNLSNEFTTVFHIAAHLHDLGKIGIDDIVLHKESHLNDEEWSKMREHPVIGYNILMRIDSFTDIAQIVRHHHERWDGKGYPDGFKKEDIPIGARIISVADSIDAMMSDRAYRKGMKPDFCRTEIERNSGIMYDPSVAAAALEHWDEIIICRNAVISQNKVQDGTL